MSVEILQRAQWDIEEIADVIRTKAGVLSADRFADRLTKTLAFLERFPATGELIEPGYFNLPGLRVMTVRQSPNYLVFFQPNPDGITVVRVLHASRDRDAVFGS